MAKIVTLAEAVATALHDGDTVAMEGFTHLIPFAAGREVIRQGRRDLTLVRMTPDVIYDQLIGAGCARKLVFSWAGNPGVGSLHRFRDAVENGWPVPLEIEEHSHAGMANRYVAGASGLPFAVLRGYAGTDLTEQTPTIRPILCPFTGETLAAVSALAPDVAVIHAQRADRAGNVQLWGITGVQKEAVLASRRSIATVEEIVDSLEPRPGAVVLPSWSVTFVAHAPGGAHPSYALGYSERDNDFYVQWDEISRDRATFQRWLDTHVFVVPEARKTSTVPEARKTSTVPEARKTSTVPEARKTSTVPEARKTSTVPEARKTSTVPEARKTSTMPEARKTSTVPEARKTSTVPDARTQPRAVGTRSKPRAEGTHNNHCAGDTSTERGSPDQFRWETKPNDDIEPPRGV